MSPNVLVLAHDADEYLPLLAEVTRSGARVAAAATPREALARGSGAAVLLAQPDLAADVLEKLPQVRWVQSTWAGITPLLRLSRRDYLLTGVKGVFGALMSEYVLGHLLARALRLEERGTRQARREWWPSRSGSLEGHVMGIMGTGSIGRHIARTAVAFGMRVTGLSRSGRPVEGFGQVFGTAALEEFLADADYVVAVLPDTPETRHLLDARAFRAMRPRSILVNVGRGNVVDEAALAEALRSGELAGAVLDVFEREPLPADSPLWDAPGLTVTAHVAAHTRPADIARLFLRNYNRYVAGEPLDYLVDFERGY